MFKKRTRRQKKGFTLVELMVGVAFVGIAIVGVGIVLIDGQRGWNVMYDRIYSGVSTDADIARRTFDRVVRKSSKSNILADETGTWVEVRYYQDSASTYLDQYARFYILGNELKVEYGTIDTDLNTYESSTQTLCSNVSSCAFVLVEGSVQMVVKLDNGSETAVVVSSAVAQN